MDFFSDSSKLKKIFLTGTLATIYIGGLYYYFSNKKKKANQFIEK